MKHLKLYETQNEYLDDILMGSASDYPMVTYAQNDDAVGYFHVPIVKTKVEMSEIPSSPIANHLNVKKLTVDGEIMWEKDTWIKKEYAISQDDFVVDDSDNAYIRGEVLFKQYALFNELNMDGKNVLIKSDYNPTHFFVLIPYDGQYATFHVRWEKYNIEEYMDEFCVKKINDNTYDVSNFYSYFTQHSPYQLLIILGNENEIVPQTLTYEYLGLAAENEGQSMEVTQDNVFTNLVNHGLVATISGEIDMMDYLGVILSMNGEILGVEPLPIGPIIAEGLGTLDSNKLSFDLSLLGGELGGVDVSYCLLDKEIVNASMESWSEMLPYVKDATVTWSSFKYLIPLPVGQHEVEMELVSYKHLPVINPYVVTEMNLRSLYGPFVETVGVCSGATNLTKIIFPKNLPNIGNYAFRDCISLTGFVIPDSVTSIGEYAFSGCTFQRDKFINNSSVTSSNNWGATLYDVVQADGLRINGSTAIDCRPNATSVTIPNSVTTIGKRVFSGCTNLTSVTIGNSVTSIGDYAFGSCSGLTEIVIPDSVIHIGHGAFTRCSGLTEVVIPDSVTSIGGYAFYQCSGLTEVVIPDSVTTIGEYAFDGTPFYNNLPDGDVYLAKCYYTYKGLMPSNTSIVVQDGTISISNQAFYKYTGLTEIVIPDSVTTIGNYAFYGCTSLTSVTIGNGVTSIGVNAFRKCSGLTEIVIPDSVTTIGEYTFCDCSNLTNVTIGNGVTTISASAFNGCKSLTSVTIGNSVITIGESAFANCSGLTEIIIPNSVTSIGNEAFYNCRRLTSVTLGNSVTSIGNDAFYNCSGLTEMIIPDSVTIIGNEAFDTCSGLTSVTIGNSVTSIGASAFSNCRRLTEVVIPDSVTSIGNYAFYSTPFYNNLPSGDVYLGKCYYSYKGSMPSNTSIVVQDGTISISDSAFSGRTSLASIEIPDSVTSIGNEAFENCSGLTSVTLGNSVTSIGGSAFYNCSGLTEIILPDSVTSIGSYAFYKCSGLTDITCYATTAPTVGSFALFYMPTNGVLRVPSGSDYSSWLSALPSGWTIEYIS